MVIYTCTQNKIHEIRSIAYLVMAEDRINYLNVSNQRAKTPQLPFNKFHESPSIACKVMAEDENNQ